jgi:uncharacterized SAM-binding protein YcdF (DUF218 family)
MVVHSEPMARFLIENGVDTRRVIEEDRSGDTLENIAFSKEIIIADNGFLPPCALVTNDYHLARSLFIAGRNGFDSAAGIAAPTPLIEIPQSYLREIGAWIKLLVRLPFLKTVN